MKSPHSGVSTNATARSQLADVSLSLRPGEALALLGLSVGTVRTYLSKANGKLGAGNRIRAAQLARGKGWL